MASDRPPSSDEAGTTTTILVALSLGHATLHRNGFAGSVDLKTNAVYSVTKGMKKNCAKRADFKIAAVLPSCS